MGTRLFGCEKGVHIEGGLAVLWYLRTPAAKSHHHPCKIRETNLPLMTGKRAFLELLKQEGVDIIFGNPGTTELPLMDALATENDLRYVLALQEAVVVGMADGYAQASGRLAVVNLHVTPGLGNA